MQELKIRIKQLRLMLKISMADFARSIDVSPGNVGDWESLKRCSVPSASALKRIAEVYDVSLDWLLFGADKKSHKYSEIVIGRYTASSMLYEKLINISLKLTESQLEDILSYAERIEKANINRKLIQQN